MKLTMAVQQGY